MHRPEKVNMSKVSTPRLAEKIIANVKAACPDSAANMSGDLTAPNGYVAPIVRRASFSSSSARAGRCL